MIRPHCRGRRLSFAGTVGLLVLLLTSLAHAKLTLAPLFTDGMVLQQQKPVIVWGQADAGATVTVKLASDSATATADAQGNWQVKLPARSASAEAVQLEVTAGSDSVTRQDVLVGEVWLCSGQSNMQWAVASSNDAQNVLANANDTLLRLFHVSNTTAVEPQFSVGGHWRAASAESAQRFSAVAYFLGVNLRRELNVPVGIIASSWGGTPIEAWTDPALMAANEITAPILARWEKELPEFPQRKAQHDQAMAQYKLDLEAFKQREEARKQKAAAASAPASADVALEEAGQAKPAPAEAEKPPVAPRLTSYAPQSPHRPGNLYHAMIHPLAPYSLRGFTWYQGESNATRAFQYRTLLPMMIANWRTRWQDDGLHFGIVQLANFRAPSAQPEDAQWAHLRDAQLHTRMTVPHTGLALAIDIGDAKDIHPRNKQEVGRRLALWAQQTVYGQAIVGQSPLYESMTVKDGKAIVTFTEVGAGLQVRGQGELQEFLLAGEDRKWVRAQAKVIAPNQVEVWSEQVPQPVAVRYAWATNPDQANLVNSADLPASPFRSDDWPGPTDNNR